MTSPGSPAPSSNSANTAGSSGVSLATITEFPRMPCVTDSPRMTVEPAPTTTIDLADGALIRNDGVTLDGDGVPVTTGLDDADPALADEAGDGSLADTATPTTLDATRSEDDDSAGSDAGSDGSDTGTEESNDGASSGVEPGAADAGTTPNDVELNVSANPSQTRTAHWPQLMWG